MIDEMEDENGQVEKNNINDEIREVSNEINAIKDNQDVTEQSIITNQSQLNAKVNTIKQCGKKSEPNNDKKKLHLHHKHLDLLMLDLANSPYLVDPKKSYTRTTVDIKKMKDRILNEFEHKAIDNEMKARMEAAKKTFIEEILNYKIDYQVLLFIQFIFTS